MSWRSPSLLKLQVKSKFILYLEDLVTFKKSYLRFFNFSVMAAKDLHLLAT